MAPKIVDKNERKHSIATGALDVFASVGFDKATISLIANQCCVGKGTVYEYFDSKEDLFLEAVMHWMHRVESETAHRMQGLAEQTTSPLTQLRQYLLTTVEVFINDPYFKKMSVLMTHLMVSHTEWLIKSELMSKTTEAFRRMIVELILAAIRAGELPSSAEASASFHAINLIAGMDGIEMHGAISEGYLDPAKQYRIYIDTYLNGIRHS